MLSCTPFPAPSRTYQHHIFLTAGSPGGAAHHGSALRPPAPFLLGAAQEGPGGAGSGGDCRRQHSYPGAGDRSAQRPRDAASQGCAGPNAEWRVHFRSCSQEYWNMEVLTGLNHEFRHYEFQYFRHRFSPFTTHLNWSDTEFA
jgi:hypothetical protein